MDAPQYTDSEQRSLKLPQTKMRQDNRLVSAAYRLSLPEKRILALAMARMVYDNLVDLAVPPYIRISSEDYAMVYLRDQFAENRQSALKAARKVLEKAGNSLYGRSFQTRERLKFGAYDEGELYNIQTRFLQEHGTADGSHKKSGYADGKLVMRFSQQVHDYLVKSSKEHGFTLCTLEQIANLESFYACRLYEIAGQFASAGRRSNIPLQSMREMILGPDDDSYPVPGDFNRYVIKKAVKEVSEKTDITVRIDPLKEASKIVAYNLIVSRKKSAADQDDQVQAPGVQLTSNDDFYQEVGLYPDEQGQHGHAGEHVPQQPSTPSVTQEAVAHGRFPAWDNLFLTIACQPMKKIQDPRAQSMFMEWHQMGATDETVQDGIFMATQYALTNVQTINGMKYYDRFVRQAVAQMKYQEMLRRQEAQGMGQPQAMLSQQPMQSRAHSQRPVSPVQQRNRMVSDVILGDLMNPSDDDW